MSEVPVAGTTTAAQSDVARMTDRLMADLVASGVRERLAHGAWDEAAWATITESGLQLALCREDDGGGFTWMDAVAVLETLGRYQIGLPLAEAMVGHGLLSHHGHPAVDDVLVLADPRTIAGARLSLGYAQRLTATLERVPWARHADRVLLSLLHEGHHILCTVELNERGNARIDPDVNAAGEPRDRIVIDGAALAWWVDLGPTGLPCPISHFGALARCAMTLGACDSTLRQTLAHCKDRVQFGKALRSFQVVQHAIATMASEVAAAGMAVSTAATAASPSPFELGGSLPFDIAAARVVVDEAAAHCRRTAHQLHGAMGFTHEHPLHHATRRLWAWRRDFGDAADWADALGQAALRAGPADLWPWIVDRGAC